MPVADFQGKKIKFSHLVGRETHEWVHWDGGIIPGASCSIKRGKTEIQERNPQEKNGDLGCSKDQ